MATTSSSGLRYPISSDSPNIAQYFQNLATDVDQKVILTVASPTERNALTGTYAHQLVREASTSRIYRRNSANSAWEYAGGAPPPIVLCTVTGGWSAIPGRAPAVYKDASGLVHIVGGVRPNTNYNPNDGAPHTAITLPTGYRPGLGVAIWANSTPATPVGGVIGIDGVLNFTASQSTNVASGVDHHLEVIPPFHPGYTGGALA